MRKKYLPDKFYNYPYTKPFIIIIPQQVIFVKHGGLVSASKSQRFSRYWTKEEKLLHDGAKSARIKLPQSIQATEGLSLNNSKFKPPECEKAPDCQQGGGDRRRHYKPFVQNTSQKVAFQGFQHCLPLSICLHIKVDITCQHINKSMVDLPACVHSELPAGVRLFSGDLIFGFGLQPNHRNLVYRKAH